MLKKHKLKTISDLIMCDKYFFNTLFSDLKMISIELNLEIGKLKSRKIAKFTGY
jgi:hypothetical protein